jgi:hypothetical protein
LLLSENFSDFLHNFGFPLNKLFGLLLRQTLLIVSVSAGQSVRYGEHLLVELDQEGLDLYAQFSSGALLNPLWMFLTECNHALDTLKKLNLALEFLLDTSDHLQRLLNFAGFH